MAEAECATGLSGWGDDPCFARDLSTLCAALEDEARLSPRGRSAAHSRLHVMLCSRLHTIDWRARHTVAAAEPIVAPLIGTGLPRAGTTFLHGLLAQDPAHRSAPAWEAALPAPPVALGSAEATGRTALYQQILDFQGYGDPALTAIHPFGAALPEECIFLQEGDCGSLYGAFFNVPTYQAAIAGKADSAYRWQIGLMQMLQSGITPGLRWTLKAPGHLFSWASLLRAFPDGRIYINHRDPAKVIPSIASLYLGLRGLYSDEPGDRRSVGRMLLAGWAQAVNALIAWRTAHENEAPIVDVHYATLIARPIETVETIYDRFGLPIDSATRTRIEAHLKVDGHGKGPKRRYTLEDYGLDEAMIEEAFGAYIDHYGIARERRT